MTTKEIEKLLELIAREVMTQYYFNKGIILWLGVEMVLVFAGIIVLAIWIASK